MAASAVAVGLARVRPGRVPALAQVGRDARAVLPDLAAAIRSRGPRAALGRARSAALSAMPRGAPGRAPKVA